MQRLVSTLVRSRLERIGTCEVFEFVFVIVYMGTCICIHKCVYVYMYVFVIVCWGKGGGREVILCVGEIRMENTRRGR